MLEIYKQCIIVFLQHFLIHALILFFISIKCAFCSVASLVNSIRHWAKRHY